MRTLGILLGLSIACGDPGTARLQVELPPITEDSDVLIRIEEREDRFSPGPIVSSLDPVRLEPDRSELSLPGLTVPNGSDRVAIVELRRRRDELISHYAISAQFSMASGDEITLEPLRLLAAPDGAVAIETSTNTTDVDVRIDADMSATRAPANEVMLSNTVTFDDTSSEKSAIAGQSLMRRWNLDRGLEFPCGETDRCLRQLYVRFSDRAGYSSATRQIAIEVDTRAPSVVATGAVKPEVRFTMARDVGRVLTRAHAGTLVSITFTASEALRGLPVVYAESEDGRTLAFGECRSASLTHTCTATVTDVRAGAEETWTVFADMTDRVFNRTTGAVLTDIVIDGVVPNEPDTVTPERIVYRRMPWGTPETGLDARFEVIGNAGAVDDGSTVLILDRADTSRAQLIGSTSQPADQTGSFGTIVLRRTDLERVYIVAVDGSGNLSSEQARLVENVEWFGSIAVDALPGTELNPHAVQRVPKFSDTVRMQDLEFARSASTAAALLALTDGAALVETGASVWIDRSLLGVDPLARQVAGFAYDRIRGRAVLFGGLSGFQIFADTREWDGQRWLRPSLSMSEPSPRYRMAMTYDSARGETVLFGGRDAAFALLDETWLYDGENWRPAISPAPPARESPAIAYDPLRGRVVLFGGYGPDNLSVDDTWEWDGATWIQIETSTQPPARANALMAFDANRGRMILFGGEVGATNPGVPAADTWEYDGATWTFVPSASPPPARDRHTLVFHEDRGALLLFGGADQNGTFFDDAWEFVGGEWSPLDLGGAGPPARSSTAMVYATSGDEALLFGGVDANGTDLADLWSFGATRVRDRTPSTLAPSPRTDAAMLYDGDRTILFGGLAPDFSWLGDTWIWDGDAWTPVATAVSAPPLEQPILVSGSAGPLLFSGGLNTTGEAELWRWIGSDWERADQASPDRPRARVATAAASDPISGELVLFGGFEYDPDFIELPLRDTHLFGTAWREVFPVDAPVERWSHAMAADLEHVFMFGGTGPGFFGSDELWSWDGTAQNWTLVAPSGSRPPGRLEHAMIFDPLRARVMIHGGFDGTGLRDAWEWVSALNEWRPVSIAGRAPALLQHGAAYDVERQRLVAFGGAPFFFAPSLDRTWELPRNDSDRPAVQIAFDWSASRREASAIDQIEVHTVAGGAGSTLDTDGLGDVVPGARLLAWNAWRGEWIESAANTAASGSPADMSASLGEAFVGGDGRIHLAVTPVAGAGNGPAPPEVAVDRLYVVVHYSVGE
jgi:hypothetical protein